MKRLSLILMFAFMSFLILAQDRKTMNKIESARIALITERLGLTPQQAEKFWPVYREYNVEKREIRQEIRNTRQSADMKNLTEEQGKELVQRSMELRQKELNLEKEYSRRFSEVISSQQLFKLKNAEKDFQQMLLRRIQEQRQKQDRNQKMMQRREMLRDRNNN